MYATHHQTIDFTMRVILISIFRAKKEMNMPALTYTNKPANDSYMNHYYQEETPSEISETSDDIADAFEIEDFFSGQSEFTAEQMPDNADDCYKLLFRNITFLSMYPFMNFYHNLQIACNPNIGTVRRIQAGAQSVSTLGFAVLGGIIPSEHIYPALGVGMQSFFQSSFNFSPILAISTAIYTCSVTASFVGSKITEYTLNCITNRKMEKNIDFHFTQDDYNKILNHQSSPIIGREEIRAHVNFMWQEYNRLKAENLGGDKLMLNILSEYRAGNLEPLLLHMFKEASLAHYLSTQERVLAHQARHILRNRGTLRNSPSSPQPTSQPDPMQPFLHLSEPPSRHASDSSTWSDDEGTYHQKLNSWVAAQSSHLGDYAKELHSLDELKKPNFMNSQTLLTQDKLKAVMAKFSAYVDEDSDDSPVFDQSYNPTPQQLRMRDIHRQRLEKLTNNDLKQFKQVCQDSRVMREDRKAYILSLTNHHSRASRPRI
jgi:hypothetical protein